MMTASLPINGLPTPAAVRRLRRGPLDPNALTPQLEPGVRASAHVVLGAILFAYQPPLAREIYEAVRPIVGPDDFGDRRDEYLFQAIRECVADGEPIDLVGIANRARSFAGADMVFSANGGDPVLYLQLEMHADHLVPNPDVAVVHAREVAAAAARYHVQLAASELLATSKSNPEDFWPGIQALLKEHIEAQAAKNPKADELPLVRVCDIPDPGPAQWLIDQLWISDAFGIVGAEPKSWKSWLTLYLGICVASGTRAFDRYDVKQGIVMVFSAEGGKGLVRRRAAALCRSMDMEIPPNLWLIDLPVLHLDQPEVAQRVINMVEKYRPALIVLDPLRELHGGDENDAVTIAALLAPLRQLQRFGCACMLVHHLGKKSEGRTVQRGGQRLRGSSALHGAVDSALYMETSGDGQHKRVIVTPEHRDEADGEPIKLRLRFHKLPELTVWLEVVTGEAEDAEKIEKTVVETSAKRKQILRAITAANLPGREPLKSASAILRVVKGTRKTVLDLVSEMTKEGVISFDSKTGFTFLQELP